MTIPIDVATLAQHAEATQRDLSDLARFIQLHRDNRPGHLLSAEDLDVVQMALSNLLKGQSATTVPEFGLIEELLPDDRWSIHPASRYATWPAAIKAAQIINHHGTHTVRPVPLIRAPLP